MARRTKAEKALDDQIDQLFRKHGNGAQIPMMELGKVFNHARSAISNGTPPDAAMQEAVAKYRVN